MSNRVSAGDNSKTIAQNKDEDQRLMTFEWCCKPVLGWIRLLGIDLKLSESQNYCKMKCRSVFGCCWFSTCVGLISFLINTVISVGFFCSNLSFISPSDPTKKAIRNKYTSTIFWNSMIDTLNTSFITLGVHFFLLASTLVNWKDLADVLHRIERNDFFKLETYRKFRRICNWGFFFIVVVGNVNVHHCLTLYMIYSKQEKSIH
jgi:hypothetical protein